MAGSAFRRGDVVSGAVLAGLGVFIVFEASRWQYSGPEGPGPGFFPLWYGMLMIALSLALVVSGARAAGGGRVDWREIGNALVTWAAFAASIALLQVLGFLLAFGLLVLFVVGVMYRRPWRVAFAVAAGNVAGFYLVFPLALNVELPVGVLGF